MFDEMMDAPAPSPKRPVRIVVHDKTKHESRTFSCDAMLLRSSMSYFATVLDQLLEVADRSSTNTPLSLNVNCDIPIFSWLVEFIHGRQPEMLPTNVVSLILSSNFLMMNQLYELGLVYLKERMVDVLLTDVNMDCIPTETVLRLAQTMTESDVARVLLGLVEGGNERCANRLFVSQLLRHVVQQRICDDPVSLQYCHHCGVLVDAEALKAVNASVCNELPCHMLGAGKVGARGEVLKTHEPTIAVADNFMANLFQSANSAAAAGSATGVLVQGAGNGSLSLVGSSSSSSAAASASSVGGDATECACWRLIGSCRVYRCDHCDTAVQLLQARHHDCGDGQIPAHNCWRGCLNSARAANEEPLLILFATVLPTWNPIRRLIPSAQQNALMSAFSSAATIGANGAAVSPSPYLAPFIPLDEQGGGAPNLSAAATFPSGLSSSRGLANASVVPLGGPVASNAPSVAAAPAATTGPILWRKGALHTAQAMQADGTPNVELIRFHETKMMREIAAFVQNFAASPTPAPSRSAASRSGAGGGGLTRANTFTGRGTRLSSALGSASSSSNSGSYSQHRGGTRLAAGGRRTTITSMAR